MEVSRRGRLALVIVASCMPSCREPLQDSPGSTGEVEEEAEADEDDEREEEPAPGPCDGEPRAWLLAPDFAGASARLAAAGFIVEPLPLDVSPEALDGLVVIGSHASEMPEYAPYMQRHAADLDRFVAGAHVVLELAQTSESEASPPFLPAAHGARREPLVLDELVAVAPDSPLLAGVALVGERLAWRGALTREAFVEQQGFEVVLAGGGDGSNAALLAASHGSGSIILSSLALDDDEAVDPEQEAFAAAFFANLVDHVQGVCALQTAPAEPEPEPGPSLPLFVEGSTTFVVLPDTQTYSLSFPSVFAGQTSWIARHAGERNIAYAFHLGDIVNDNTSAEWMRASAAMAELDGLVPYGLVTGNHDYGPHGNAATRETLLNEWFSFDDTELMPSFGGAFQAGKLDNTYHLFEAGGHAWVALMLEWGPRDEVVAWANAVMAEHPQRLGILVTHAYLNHDDRRYDHTDSAHSQAYNPHWYGTAGGVNDGEELWQKLVRQHRFVLTLNGHVLGDGTGRLASVNDRGNVVHQLLSNYQHREFGGEGYLRLLELLPDGRTMQVRTYSTMYDQYLTAPDQQFVIELDVE